MKKIVQAVRWSLDVVRGYGRAADGVERARELLADGGAERSGAAAFVLAHLADQRNGEGPLALGARLAIEGGELAGLLARAEAGKLGVVAGEAIGDA